jgi:hypothetical protein
MTQPPDPYGQQPPPAEPPPGASSGPPGPPPGPPPPSGAYPSPQPQPQPGYNVVAILALIFAFVFAPVGIILGIIARRQIRQSGERGQGLATAGLVLGIIFTGLAVLLCCLGVIVAFLTAPANT